MLRRPFWILTLVLAFLGSSAARAKDIEKPKQPELHIVVTYSLHSQSELMARVSSYVHSIPSHKLVLLDLGRQWNWQLYENHITRGEFSFQLFQSLPYDAAAVDLRDGIFPLQQWTRWQKDAQFPWILTNVQTEKGTYPFLPYWIVHRRDYRIALLAIVGEREFRSSYYRHIYPSLQAEDGEKALRRFLHALSYQTNVRLLLSQASRSRNVFLATQFPELSFICAVEPNRTRPLMQKVRKTQILWLPRTGQWMLDIQFFGSEKWKAEFLPLKRYKPHRQFLRRWEKRQKDLLPKEKMDTHLVWKKPPLSQKAFRIWAATVLCDSLLRQKDCDVVLLHLPSLSRSMATSSSSSPETAAQLFRLLPVPNRAFELLVSGKALQTIWNSPLRYEFFIYGLSQRIENGKVVLYVRQKPLQPDKVYHIFYCSGTYKSLFREMDVKKVLKVLEQDFFSYLLGELQKKRVFQPVVRKKTAESSQQGGAQ